MKKSRFIETQVVAILKEVDTGLSVKEVCRKHAISDATYYNWKSKYGDMSNSDLKRMSGGGGQIFILDNMGLAF